VGREVDLLRSYPRTKRNIEERIKTKSEKSREIARKFGEEFFDGDREHGYGGFAYNPKFWTGVVSDLIDEYHLNNQSSVLDVGCAKGFLLHDLKIALPGIKVKGIDVSDYAIMNSIDTVKTDLLVASADKLPFADNSFDLVLSINTIHLCNTYLW
jgi:SAM-dependent methyltransferase